MATHTFLGNQKIDIYYCWLRFSVLPSVSSSSLPHFSLPQVYPGYLIYFLFPGRYMCPNYGPSCYVTSLELRIVVWLSCALHLLSTYDWIHTIFVFLSLGYLTQDGFLLVPFICLQISWYVFLLNNTPMCRYITFSLSILQWRVIYVVFRSWILQIMLLWT